jgi:isopentenyl diphosphate isomerase/L-lactate dehydrogenase-like FMN-dependent dehydrogenase
VHRSLEILRTDMSRTMKLLGCPSVKELNGSYVSRDRW